MRPYRLLFDHVLTRVDAERAHRAAMAGLRVLQPGALRLPARPAQAAGPVHALGLRFAHPLGLAAGLDKNAVAVDALAALGFGHVEVGTVTALPQPGNPAPRLFRLPEDRAIVNRMGFNNAGAEAVARRLARRAAARAGAGRPGPVLGVNIGRSRVVPDDDAPAVAADHATSTRLLAPWADYLVVNVSSPNTPGLRDLQAVERLAPLLDTVRRTADQASPERRVPLLVKIAPDLDDADVLAVAELALGTGLDGIIATNTTLSRDGLATDPDAVAAAGAGGLSGRPLRRRALEVLRLLSGRVGDQLTLVGVGGISDAADARERLDAGARLVQAYSGFVYGGARWPSALVGGLGGAEPS